MKKLKKIIYSNDFMYHCYKWLRRLKQSLSSNLKITNNGCGKIKKEVEGKGHKLIINDGTVLLKATIHMKGRNNTIIFGEKCYVGPGCSFWVEGENASIIIGNHVTFTRNCHLNAQENDMCITVGDDCMFSNSIVVRTSDSHPIYSKASGERINNPSPVVINEHVWIAPNSKIMKGVTIGSGTIIGSDTMVTKSVSLNVLVVGHPGRVVKSDIKWTREDIIFNQNGDV